MSRDEPVRTLSRDELPTRSVERAEPARTPPQEPALAAEPEQEKASLREEPPQDPIEAQFGESQSDFMARAARLKREAREREVSLCRRLLRALSSA
jgi:hypothetical protein